MVNENILTELSEKIDDYKFNLEKQDDSINFLKYFLKHNNLNANDNYLKINIADLLKALLIKNSTNLTYDEINTYVEHLRIHLEIFSYDKLSTIIKFIDFGIKNYNIDDFKRKSKEKILKQNMDDKNKQIFFESINSFIFFLAKDNNIFFKDFEVILKIKKARECHKLYDDATKNIVNNFKEILVAKGEKGFFDFQEINLDNLNKTLNNLNLYCNKRVFNYNEKTKILRKNFDNYNKVYIWLKANKEKQEIVNIPPELLEIASKSLKIKILRNIYNHNNLYYKELSDNYRTLENDSFNKYKLLFKEYGMNINKSDLDLTKDISDIEKILKMLNDIGITSHKYLLDLVNNSDVSKITDIYNYKKSGFIDKNFIIHNISIFKDKYDYFCSNIKLLEEKQSSPSKINKIQNNLLTNSTIFNNNIDILEKYNLFNRLFDTNYVIFLKSTDLKEKIDILLELGFENILKKDLTLLNYDKNLFKRLIVLKKINMLPDQLEEIELVLNKKDFILKDEELDNYILNINIDTLVNNNIVTKENVINKLEDINNTDLTYNFDDVLISKNKVLENLENLPAKTNKKQVLKAICKNSFLDEEQYLNIYNILFKEKIKK